MLTRYLRTIIIGLWLIGLLFVAAGVLMYFVLNEPRGMQDSRLKSLGILGGLGVLCWVLALTWNRFQPTARRLRKFGPRLEVLADIDRELAQPEHIIFVGPPPSAFTSPRHVKGRVLLTPSWLLQFETSYEVGIVRLADVVWIRITPLALFGQQVLDIRLRNGVRLLLGLRTQDAEFLFRELLGRLPWVMVGEKEIWDKVPPQERAQLIGALDQLRAQIQALTPEQRQAVVAHKLGRPHEVPPLPATAG
jgi:hypothetical protein